MQLCITLNNIEHVRVYLDNLPHLLQWDKNVNDLTIEHDDDIAGKNTLDALHRLTAMASKDVLMKSSMLEKKIADRMCSEVSKFMENVVNPSATNDADVRNKCDPILILKGEGDFAIIPLFKDIMKTMHV